MSDMRAIADQIAHRSGTTPSANSRSCRRSSSNSPLSRLVERDGGGDFDAFEKSWLGWLSGPVRTDVDSLQEIGSIEGPTTLPQALVITTAASEFWFESRGVPTPSFYGESVQPPGVVAVAGPGPGGGWVFPRANLLVQNPSGGARYAFQAGESVVRRRVFAVTVESQTVDRALLRFHWLDKRAPRRPNLSARATRRGRIRVNWD